MTLRELIRSLQELASQHGDTLPVYTRGSQSTTMVPASDVRKAKLKSGPAIFIGKPKHSAD